MKVISLMSTSVAYGSKRRTALLVPDCGVLIVDVDRIES